VLSGVRARLRESPRTTTAVTFTSAVTGIAAYASYWHVQTFTYRYHAGDVMSHLYAVTIDGLLVMGTLGHLDAKMKRPDSTPWLPYFIEVLGVLVTGYINVSDGLQYGAVSGAVSVWPAIAFALAFRQLMQLLSRKGAVTVEEDPAVAVTADVTPTVMVSPAVTVTPDVTNPAATIEPAVSVPAISEPAVTVTPFAVMPPRPRRTAGTMTVRELVAKEAANRGVSESTIWRERRARKAAGEPESEQGFEG